MPKFRSENVVDNGLESLRTAAATAGRIVQHLVVGDASAMSYAQVVAASIANVALAQADLTISTDGTVRRIVVAAKSGVSATANSGATPDLHLAIVDSVQSRVELVTDETSDQVITSGNQLNFPSWQYRVPQAV